METLPEALHALGQYDQFFIYKVVPRGDKLDKLPCDLTGEPGDAHNSAIWTDAATAISVAKSFGPSYGVAFTLTEADPFYFFDIDNCGHAGQWNERAAELMAGCAGAAVEVSVSGTGLHIIGTGAPSVASGQRRKKSVDNTFDLYTEKRFIALTGNMLGGSAATRINQGWLDAVVTTFLTKSASAVEWGDGPREDWDGIRDDEKLIKAMLKTKPNAEGSFGARATVVDLWKANEEKLARAFPDDHGGGGYDASKADAALAQHLAFWTGCDCERMARLMHRSALAREKYEREDYLPRTILNAVSMQEHVFTRPKADPCDVAIEEIKVVSGAQFLSAQGQIEHFAGCVYIQDMHKAYTPKGALLKPEQFNATYGGYLFEISTEKSVDVAWKAFTESQIVRYPIAFSSCFKPDVAPGTITRVNGEPRLNLYLPVEVVYMKGDVTPFLTHVEKLLPIKTDRDIVLAYMAACIQYKGTKFQWAPLLQGAEGNGKTLLTRCISYAVGEKYAHMPPASEIAEKYNAWLFEKLFIGIEDVYVPEHKQEVIEILKPMITNDRLACRDMQKIQAMKDNVANFMLNSNHRDAIRKTQNDRRFCVFYTAQQSKSDIDACGMDNGYFGRLYDWLKDDGYAKVADYLNTYPIPDALNPAKYCQRAPITSSTNCAIEEGLGGVEQEVLEAINERRQGFSGGWLSSMALDRLLRDMGTARRIPRNRRKKIIQELGYVAHPGLPDGRSTSVVPFEMGRPRLYVKKGHKDAGLTCPREIAKAYEAAQL